jgi:hypothetical protein
MTEDEFVEKVTQLMKGVLPDQFVLQQKANLYYQIVADNNLNIAADLKNPKRGDSAFQTDLCIFLKKNDILLPKIVFEFKGRDITTHDIITYSNKAKRHKQIYPYLRYGLISYERSVIPKRFFIHNEGLDFYLATKEYTKNLQHVLKTLIEEELEISDKLESTIFGSDKYDFYRTNIEFKIFGER